MSIAISRDWQDLDIEDPHEAWDSFCERMRREMAGHERCATKLRRDAADALEQAEEHERRALEFRHLVDAMLDAPVTRPCDSGSGPKGENSRSEVEGEAPQSGDSEAGASPILPLKASHD